MASYIKITQVRSDIKRPGNQRLTLRNLGLGKMHRSVVHKVTPQLLGMVRQISHMVLVEETTAPEPTATPAAQ